MGVQQDAPRSAPISIHRATSEFSFGWVGSKRVYPIYQSPWPAQDRDTGSHSRCRMGNLGAGCPDGDGRKTCAWHCRCRYRTYNTGLFQSSAAGAVLCDADLMKMVALACETGTNIKFSTPDTGHIDIFIDHGRFACRQRRICGPQWPEAWTKMAQPPDMPNWSTRK